MTIEQILKEKPMSITIQEAAKIMEVTQRFLQLALQQNRFPFGTAVKGNRWIYYINTERFLIYMKGEDMS